MSTISVQMVKIPVDDVGVSVPFYRDVIGLSEDFVMAEYGWAQLSAGNLPIALYQPNKGGGQGKPGVFDSLHFATDNLDPIMKRLKENGVDTSDMPFTGDDGSLSIDLDDPDGNRIKVMLIADSA